jgi:hypothetical protein
MIQSTAADLNCYTGMNITEICPFKYNTGNQCAHFVSHAVGIAVGATCKNASWENRQNKAIAQGASLRANEVYNSCVSRGPWGERNAAIATCLIFVTCDSNVTGNMMLDAPQKHVGVYLNGTIWHYSNTHGRVQTDTVDSWFSKFKGIYSGNVSLFYAVPA